MPNIPASNGGGPGRRHVLAGLIATVAPSVLAPGATAQPARPLAVPLAFRANAAVASPPITVGHFFAEGDIPAGSRVGLRAQGGATVPVQQDAETHWPDGSLRFAVLSFVAPESYAAGQVRTYTVTAEAGAPDRRPGITPAGMAGRGDFRLKMYGHDLGADVLWVSANAVLTSATVDRFGASPTTWVETVAAGPIRNEYRVGAYARREGDGAMHRTLAADLYIRHWLASDTWEIAPWPSQPDAYGPHPAGRIGPDKVGRLAFIAELYNGDTRLAAFGGPHDPRAVQVPASAFDTATNRFAMPANLSAGGAWTGGVLLGFRGNLPSGLSPNGAYVPANIGKERKALLSHIRDFGLYYPLPQPWKPGEKVAGNERRTLGNRVFRCIKDGATGSAMPAAGGEGDVTDGGTVWRPLTAVFGRPGGGTITAYPLVHCFAGTGWIGMGPDAARVRVGAGPKPDLLPSHDLAYMIRARGIPPYDLSLKRPMMPGTPAEYEIGSIYADVIRNIEATSDDANVDRIGWLPWTHASSLLVPFDRVRHRTVLRQALSWADYPIHFRDTRSARLVVVNNGPAKDGRTYPGMAPVNPDFFLHTRGGDGKPGFGAGYAPAGASDRDGWGYTFAYNQLNSGAHTPCYWFVPYLRTGDAVYLEIGKANAWSMVASNDPGYNRANTVGGIRYWGIVKGQQRGIAWTFRDLSHMEFMLPDSAPEKPMFRDFMSDNAGYYTTLISSSPARHLGLLFWVTDDYGGRPFQHYMLAFVLNAMVFRGDERWRPYTEAYAGYYRDLFDDRRYPNGTGWIANEYELLPQPPGGTPFPTQKAMIEHAAGPGPYPAAGLRGGAGYYNDGGRIGSPKYMGNGYVTMLMAVQAVGQSVGIAGCGRVRRQLLRRILPPGADVAGLPVSSDTELYPTWAFVPYPNPAAS